MSQKKNVIEKPKLFWFLAVLGTVVSFLGVLLTPVLLPVMVLITFVALVLEFCYWVGAIVFVPAWLFGLEIMILEDVVGIPLIKNVSPPATIFHLIFRLAVWMAMLILPGYVGRWMYQKFDRRCSSKQ